MRESPSEKEVLIAKASQWWLELLGSGDDQCEKGLPAWVAGGRG
jgi:hypothetical protein